eukprot:225651-Prymnesium_polylepis.1
MIGSVKAASAPGSPSEGGSASGSPGPIRSRHIAQSAAHTASIAAAADITASSRTKANLKRHPQLDHLIYAQRRARIREYLAKLGGLGEMQLPHLIKGSRLACIAATEALGGRRSRSRPNSV